MTDASPSVRRDSLPSSFLTRLGSSLEKALEHASLVHLWGWPGSGLHRLVETLPTLLEQPVEVVPSETLDAWLADPSAAPWPPGTPWPSGTVRAGWVPSLDTVSVETLASHLGDGQRLIVACPRRPLTTPRTAGVLERLTPSDFLLRQHEAVEWFAELPRARVESAWQTTEGWLRPLELTLGEPMDEAEGIAELRRTVLAGLTVPELTVLASLAAWGTTARDSRAPAPNAATTPLDLDRWRLAHAGKPAFLGALESLRFRCGLLPGDRLPAVLRQVPWQHLDLPRLDESPRRWEEAGALLAETRPEEGATLTTEATGTTPAGPKESMARPARVEESTGPAEAPRFEVRLLGEPVVERIEGSVRTVLRWRLRRALGTVAFLALAEDHRARKEALLEALWSEASAGSIQRNFHPSLSEARRTLAEGRFESLRFEQDTYAFAPGVVWWVDVATFEEAVEAGHAARRSGGVEAALGHWQDAWKLYRGPLLAADDAAWIRPRRHRLQERYLAMLRGLGELAAAHDEPTLAIDAYRTVLIEEAYEEPVHRALMELYARRGRRDLVRRQFVRLQELLLDDLGIEPSVETQERYHELMR